MWSGQVKKELHLSVNKLGEEKEKLLKEGKNKKIYESVHDNRDHHKICLQEGRIKNVHTTEGNIQLSLSDPTDTFISNIYDWLHWKNWPYTISMCRH